MSWSGMKQLLLVSSRIHAKSLKSPTELSHLKYILALDAHESSSASPRVGEGKLLLVQVDARCT
jgi:hypothetical protein